MPHFFFDLVMGALISKRKRSDDCFIPNFKSPSLNSEIRSSKRRKTVSVSSMNRIDKPVLSKSAASRIYSYPEPLNKLPREVHGPCRPTRLGFAACLKRNPNLVDSYEMGNAISHRYEDVKKKAISSLQYFNEEKEKQVIDDKEEDDSSVEVIEIVDNDSAEMDCVVNFRDSASSMDSVLTSTKVESTGRMSNSLTMNQQPLHRQLYEDSVRKRNNPLSGLSFKIDLLEKKRNIFGLYRQVKKPEKVVVTEPFVPLTKEEDVNIKRAFSNSNRRKVLVTHEDSSLQITGEMLQCLRPGAWLNDEVINLYLELLKEREKREPKKFLKCHFFNTFFYKKLNGRSGYDYKSVRRWTTQRKLGYSLFDCDKIFVPIHKDVHWCLAVISKKEEKFQYLDSLRGRDKEVMKVLAKYIVDEVKDKNGKDIDVHSWKHEYVEDLPDQENGFDCGMFMIKYIDFYSRNVGLCFNQEHMPYFRLRTAKEILKLRAE